MYKQAYSIVLVAYENIKTSVVSSAYIDDLALTFG